MNDWYSNKIASHRKTHAPWRFLYLKETKSWWCEEGEEGGEGEEKSICWPTLPQGVWWGVSGEVGLNPSKCFCCWYWKFPHQSQNISILFYRHCNSLKFLGAVSCLIKVLLIVSCHSAGSLGLEETQHGCGWNRRQVTIFLVDFIDLEIGRVHFELRDERDEKKVKSILKKPKIEDEDEVSDKRSNRGSDHGSDRGSYNDSDKGSLPDLVMRNRTVRRRQL